MNSIEKHLPASQQEMTEVRDQAGSSIFYDYLESVCRQFRNMRTAERFVISTNVKDRNIRLFACCVVIYMLEFGDIAFNKDYSQIIKF